MDGIGAWSSLLDWIGLGYLLVRMDFWVFWIIQCTTISGLSEEGGLTNYLMIDMGIDYSCIIT